MTEKEQKKREQGRRANRVILWRTMFLMAAFGVAVFVPLLGKLWKIQIIDHNFYQDKAIGQQTSDLTVSANRGTIYDSSGAILAMSATVQTVVLSPRDVVELQQKYAEAVADGKAPDYPAPSNELIASGLASILDVEESAILERLAKTSRQYEVVKAKVEEDVAAQVTAFISENHLSPGVFLNPDTKRYYPNSSLASHVLGFVNAENNGAYGLEAKYNESLSGEDGRVVTAKNAKGTEMPSRYENYINSVDGSDLHLTIDANIQQMLESALAEGIETYDVQYGGWGIAMDPKTGAILGMASSPDYDLNNYSVISDPAAVEELAQLKETATSEEYSEALRKALDEQWRNKAVNYTYEPGSTFKAMVLAAALEEGVVSESDIFTCSGSATVAGTVISCSNKNGHGVQDLAKAVENSCNPAFIEIGQRLGAEKFYDYLERYNLVGKTGVDLPGEYSNDDGVRVWSRSYFTSPEGYLSLATASFGQRFQVTPIQLITAFSSVINGGHLMEPYVVESITGEDGSVLFQHQVTEVRQVVSEETSAKVRTILEGVVDGGTGKNAYMAGYRIGGKTGTSQILNDKRNIVSFVGFAPADDPQVIVLLAFDRPQPASEGSSVTAGDYYISGGWMAAPLTGKLIANILDHMGVQKQYTAEELSGVDTTVPLVVGYSLEGAQTLLNDSGLSSRTIGEGAVVTGQIPAQGASIPGNSQVVLYMGEEVPTDQVEVPSVVGMTPQEAQETLGKAGLYIRATGAVEYTSSNKAVSQSLQQGVLVERGTVVEVQFIDGSVVDYAGPEIGN